MPVEEHGAGLGRVDDRVLPVLVHGRLDGGHHAGAHLHALGAERERGGHRAPVDEAAGGDDRHVDLRRDERQQHHGRHVLRVLEPAALGALDHQPVDAGVDRLQRGPQARHHVEDGEPGVLEPAR